MHSEVEILPVYPSVNTKSCVDWMSTSEDMMPHYNQSNSNNSTDETILDDYSIVSTSELPEIEDNHGLDDDYYAQFIWPDDVDNDHNEYSSDDENDEKYLNKHLNYKQLNEINQLEQTTCQRSKRSNKKIKAQCQIKTKYAKSIRYNSHNKQLYIHHRLFKQVQLDPPSYHFLSTPSARTIEIKKFNEEVQNRRQVTVTANSHTHNQPVVHPPATNPPNQFRDYTINEHTIPNEPTFDDTMISFLLDMQNRDLSPNDYEMLLRLDERVQRKTLDNSLINKLQTIHVNETHLNDHCIICMEGYLLGQQLKILPCNHIFHINCIETYLKEFSTQCPLDNLPLI
ncbi:hypothetical protein I4U23_025465 [Adineta vaga]|nr:hypothetical protein I4U23_025465 [Adineta vaga]